MEKALKILMEKGKNMPPRKSGEAYTSHSREVAARCIREGLSLQYIIVALLHDLPEDGLLSLDSIRDKFGEEIASSVDALTHREGESYLRYVFRLSRNRVASNVKWHDILANMDGFQSPKKRFLYPLSLVILYCSPLWQEQGIPFFRPF